ncbi:EH signature domain-containing protein [Caballeronia sp. LZ001]|uniref:EH signature domain-containing protein n=1 Tax=Caballeronia sp. LZ001 TaxID=3038553 RepID=UPI0028677E44|nr:EH signature domain-containing protein [Caballeronia sp. LZ001]MDR5803739.1 EH signature domain-containing protein [Caballeronia sp. LZ001]
MQLGADALSLLKSALDRKLVAFSSDWKELGQPALVEKASEQAKRTFEEYASARPSARDAYASALAFLRGHELDESQKDTVASALNQAVSERQGARPIGSDRLTALFRYYEDEAVAGTLWRLTWFGLLVSYFSYDPLSARGIEHDGWLLLRKLLATTWSHIDSASGNATVPDWLAALRRHPALISERAADEFADHYLAGDRTTLDLIVENVGIPESSWFWHSLVLSAVKTSAGYGDERFVAHIPRLIALIKSRPVFRDEALEILLARYHRIPGHPVHHELRDYVVGKDVWRNPKLKAAGIATAWNRVPDSVWRMVLQWVNEGNLRDFFDVLAARNSADEGRLAFWSRYMRQISWTRLIFSNETVLLARSNRGIRELIAREAGAYATLYGNKNIDAFIMQIGEYIIVEFSTTGNAAYVYDSATLRFDRYSPTYHGGTEDLRYGFRTGARCRIIHNAGWQSSAAHELARLGIRPDEDIKQSRLPSPTLVETRQIKTSPQSGLAGPGWVSPTFPSRVATQTPFSMAALEAHVEQYIGAYVDDRRQAASGRLWVEDPRQDMALGRQLKAWGFKWAHSRSAWYYAE